MIVFATEDTVKPLFKDSLSKSVSVFTYVKAHKKPNDPNINIPYTYLGPIAPSADSIAGVSAGDIKPRELLSKLKAIMKNPFPSKHERDIHDMIVSALTIANISTGGKDRLAGVVVIIRENEEGDTAEATRKANAFMYKWLTTMFSPFGIHVLTNKEFKKVILPDINAKKLNVTKGDIRYNDVFTLITNSKISADSEGKKMDKKDVKALRKDVKRKKVKKLKRKGKTIRSNIATIDRELMNIYSSKGREIAYLQCMQLIYGPETAVAAISTEYSRGGTIRHKNQVRLARQLFSSIEGNFKDSYTDAAKEHICTNKPAKDKMIQKFVKAEGKESKKLFDYYNIFANIFASARAKAPSSDIPKIKPFKKRGGKTKKYEPAVKFFKDRKNLHILGALCAHIVCLRTGVDFGSTQYIKAVTEMLSKGSRSLAKTYEDTVKAVMQAAREEAKAAAKK